MFLSEWRNFLRRFALQEKKLDSSRLDVVEIAHVPDMLTSLFPSWSGLGLISTPARDVTDSVFPNAGFPDDLTWMLMTSNNALVFVSVNL